MKVKVNDKEFYIDGYLKSTLDTARKVIKQDWDMVFVIDGSEGTGKSVLAQQCAMYCDNDFNIDRIVFTPHEFKKAIFAANKYQAVIYDEAYTGLSARAAMTQINRTLVSMLAEIRQKNLFVFVLMPTFFDLDKYVALWRSRALINVYTGDKFQRGFFKFFNATKKKDLYINGKKFYNYSKPESNFIGRFTNVYAVDVDDYKKKKRDALLDREKKTSEAQLRQEMINAMFDRVVSLPNKILDKLSIDDRCKIIGISRGTYYSYLEKWEQNKLYTGI